MFFNIVNILYGTLFQAKKEVNLQKNYFMNIYFIGAQLFTYKLSKYPFHSMKFHIRFLSTEIKMIQRLRNTSKIPHRPHLRGWLNHPDKHVKFVNRKDKLISCM